MKISKQLFDLQSHLLIAIAQVGSINFQDDLMIFQVGWQVQSTAWAS